MAGAPHRHRPRLHQANSPPSRACRWIRAAPGFDLDGVLAELGPAAALVEATVRNSANPTMLSAGYKLNVIPGQATAYVDGRMLPGGEAEFIATLDAPDRPRRARGSSTTARSPSKPPWTGGRTRSCASPSSGSTRTGTWCPFCMAGGTDAKQFSRLGITGYGFSPLKLPPGFDYWALFHGVDERVPVEALHFGVRVLDHALRTL